MPLKLSAKRSFNKSSLSPLPASVPAIVAAALPSVGAVRVALACNSRSCDSNVGDGGSVACDARASRGEGRRVDG
jgi:hypothetical protein